MFGKNIRSESSKNKIFCGFHVFKYVLWKETETWKSGNQNRKLSKSRKHPVLTFQHYQKTGKKQSLCYLSTVLALTRKATSSFNGKSFLITLSNTLRSYKKCFKSDKQSKYPKKGAYNFFSVVFGFSNVLYGKKWKPGNAGN